jgi:hypothetical protein
MDGRRSGKQAAGLRIDDGQALKSHDTRHAPTGLPVENERYTNW